MGDTGEVRRGAGYFHIFGSARRARLTHCMLSGTPRACVHTALSRHASIRREASATRPQQLMLYYPVRL